MAKSTTINKGSEKAGTLVIIGGHEDRTGERHILKEIANRIGDGKLVVSTIASASAANDLWLEYQAAFAELGVKQVEHLAIAGRKECLGDEPAKRVNDARGFFFTGGDQLRITSELGGTPLLEAISALFYRGGVVCGTSAGAAVMADTMLVSGVSESTYRKGSGLRMAPGLGFMANAIIDQHFSERGRIGRLLGAIAQNPQILGVGIDEDTAIIVEKGTSFRVVGAGGVYVVDAHSITDTNICDASTDEALSLFNVKLHLLSSGDSFDLFDRNPAR